MPHWTKGNQQLSLRYLLKDSCLLELPMRANRRAQQRGETIVEYVLMLGLIFLLVILATVTVGDRASLVFSRASETLLNIGH